MRCTLPRGQTALWRGTSVGGPRRCFAGANPRIGRSFRPWMILTTFRPCWPANSLTTLNRSFVRSRFIAAGGLDPLGLRCGRVCTITTELVVIFRTGSGCPSSSSTMYGVTATATWSAPAPWILMRCVGSGSLRSVLAEENHSLSGLVGSARETRRWIIATHATDHVSLQLSDR